MAQHGGSQGKPIRRSYKPRGRSCLPCRKRKLGCDCAVPCKACVRAGREDDCWKNPSPAILRINSAPRRPLLQGAAKLDPLGSAPGSQSVQESRPSPAPTIVPGVPEPSPSPATTPALQLEHLPREADDTESEIQPTAALAAPELRSVAVFQACNQSGRAYEMPGPYSTTIQHQPCHGGRPDAMKSAFLIGYKPDTALAKIQLSSLLPSQIQCDALVSFFYLHCDWVHRSIHVPTFREEYTRFWSLPVLSIDLSWLSLLFVIISTAALWMPSAVCDAFGLELTQLRQTGQAWFHASGQALQAADFEAHPTIYQLQTFIISQIYHVSRNGVEALNSALGRAVRNAHALGLDKRCTSSNVLEREMRHRIWWELCHADTWQSMCLARPPLIQSYLSRVPFPMHCNNTDIIETATTARPLDEVTDLSGCLVKYKLFKIFNKFYKENCDHVQSYAFVEEIDAELRATERDFPWFFQLDHLAKYWTTPRAGQDDLPWVFYALHSCLCMQRLRMYRPFLQSRTAATWPRCVTAAESALDVYKALRSPNPDTLRNSVKFAGIGYQTFSVATFLGLFLLIERPEPADRIRADLDMVLEDLAYVVSRPDRTAAAAEERHKVLKMIIEACDSRLGNIRVQSSNIVPGIYSVFGGESSSRAYLDRAQERAIEQQQPPRQSDEITNDNPLASPPSTHRQQQELGFGQVPTPMFGTLAANTDCAPYRSFNAADLSLDVWQWDQWDQWDSIFDGQFDPAYTQL